MTNTEHVAHPYSPQTAIARERCWQTSDFLLARLLPVEPTVASKMVSIPQQSAEALARLQKMVNGMEHNLGEAG